MVPPSPLLCWVRCGWALWLFPSPPQVSRPLPPPHPLPPVGGRSEAPRTPLEGEKKPAWVQAPAQLGRGPWGGTAGQGASPPLLVVGRCRLPVLAYPQACWLLCRSAPASASVLLALPRSMGLASSLQNQPLCKLGGREGSGPESSQLTPCFGHQALGKAPLSTCKVHSLAPLRQCLQGAHEGQLVLFRQAYVNLSTSRPRN